MDQAEPDDPKYWSIERVIYEVCQNDSPPWASADTSPGASLIPDRHELEAIFRKNHIDGENLLALGMKELRDELNIPSYGQRRAILKAVGFLSQRYVANQKVHSYLQEGLATPEVTYSRLSPFGQSPAYHAFGVRPSIEPHNTFGSPSFTTGAVNHQVAGQLHGSNAPRPLSYPRPHAAYNQSPRQQPSGYALSERKYSAGQRLPSPTFDQPKPSNQAKPSGGIHADGGKPVKATSGRGLEVNDEAGYLDVLDDSINQTLNPEASSPIAQLSQASDHKAEVGTQTLTKATKRLAPTLVSAPVDKGKLPSQPSSAQATDNLPRGYLGQTKFHCKDVLYSIRDHGAEDDEDYDGIVPFTLLAPFSVSGLQVVIARRMMELYRKLPIVNHNDGRAVMQAHLRPKIAKCAPEQRLAIMKSDTVFTSSTPPQFYTAEPPLAGASYGGTLSDASTSNATNPVEVRDPFSSRHNNHDDLNSLDQYEYLLEKYPPSKEDHPEDDVVLPLYGDSGDENDYDDATWEEIEKEKRQVLQRSKVMTKDEVNQAVNEALEDLRKTWLEEKFPKVQIKGYNLWLRAARERRRQIPIQAKQDAAKRARQTLAKYREAIVGDAWQKPIDVEKQCQSLEMKLFDALENEYFVQVLQGDDAPIRPPRGAVKAKSRKFRETEDDEETIGSDSDVALDDFVVEDEIEAPMPDDPGDEDFKPTLPGSERVQVKPMIKEADIVHQLDDIAAETPQTPAHEDPMNLSAEEGDIDDNSDIVLSSRAKSVKKKRRTPLSIRRHNIEDMPKGLSSVGYSESDSDLDAGPRLPKTKYRNRGHSESLAIDLTFSDDKITTPGQITTDFEVVTPELNPVDASQISEDMIDVEKKQPLELKPESSSATKTPTRLPLSARLHRDGRGPDLDDVEGIRQLDWDTIEERSDHKRAVRKRLYSLEREQANDTQAFLDFLSRQQPGEADGHMNVLNEGMQMLKNNLKSIRSAQGARNQRAALELVKLYLTYVCCRDVEESQTISEGEWNEAFEQKARGCNKCFMQVKAALLVYLQFLGQALHAHKGKKRKSAQADANDDTMDSKLFRLSVTPQPFDTGTDYSEGLAEERQQPSHKKRKRHVAQSQEALAQQRSDQQRIKEQEQRRSQMEKKIGTMAKDDTAQHYVNIDEPLVYLNDRIARRIKPHQIKGLRFLWREIVADPNRQGCLLAHTMGLGKTMQVVSLLVTIAECTQSENERFRNHVPPELRPGRTLILCPPSLLENWEDELAMWTPKDDPALLGSIRKIRQGRDMGEIRDWARSSGVLLLSYNLFQRYLDPKKPLADDRFTREELETWLLDRPSLVIADEAHNMKNAKAKISLAASRFKTLSRIALTGSPLNNHLEEYHTMINWVAPGYLGTMVQFKSNYSEPIIQGLWADSSAYERRLCLRKLHVLKRDLEPKVNRADISAIQEDMPPKTEFFITIPLTEIQRHAYDTYVQRLLDDHDEPGAKRNKLLAWLGDLLLLCNHPSAFVDLCNVRSHEKRRVEDTGDETACSEIEMKDSDENDGLSPANPEDPFERRIPVSKKDLTAMEAAAATFEDVQAFGNLNDWTLSNRTLIVGEIVQKAVRLGDKTLIFSHSIYTLNLLQCMLEQLELSFMRIDGSTNVNKRQKATKTFNNASTNTRVFLISTKAGGLGLNLQGANRVILFDFNFNPMWEEQAIGRAYRLGQRKPVYVYRFRSGGTCEEVVNNKAVFKSQLFSRVVDKKNPERYAKKSVAEYLFPVRHIDREAYEKSLGKDLEVLDSFMAEYPDVVRNLELTETFQKEDDEKLTEEEIKAANEEFEDERLRRNDPKAWSEKQAKKQKSFASHPRMLPPDFLLNLPGASQGPLRPGVGGSSTPKKPADLLHGSPRRIVVPDFKGILERSHEVAAEDAGQTQSPAKILQTDGTNDDPAEAASSGDDESQPPGCKTQ